MGQCTSKHEQQKAVVVGGVTNTSGITLNMERGASNSSMSMASSTMQNLAQYLAENPEKVGVNGGKPKKRGSFILRDSACSPAGEDMSCSATTLNMSMELSDRSSLWMPTSTRSRSPKRSSSISTSATMQSRSASNRSPKRNISNESNGSRNSYQSGHCWAALRDTTDRDYTTGTNGGASDVNQLDPFGLDTLPEELAIRQQPSISTNSNEKQGEEASSSTGEKNKPGKEYAETLTEGKEEQEVVLVGATEETETGNNNNNNNNNNEMKKEMTKQDNDDNLNKNSASSATRRRRSRRRSRRDWQRSSGVYVPPSQAASSPNATKQASYRRTGTEESIDPAKLKEGKESSWQALSCTSKHSDSYTSYASSNISYLTFNDSNGNKVDLGRYQKDAMGNMHGFCWTESEGEDDDNSSLEDLTEEEEGVDEEEATNREIEEELKFWETNVLRS